MQQPHADHPSSTRRLRSREKAWIRLTFLMVMTLGLPVTIGGQDGVDYELSTSGTRWLEARDGGLTIKVLVEEANLGSGEVEVGEITFPAGSQGGGHTHGSIEIFYVLSGVMDHIVNGESHVLEPGMVGIVRPGDTVMHRTVSDTPVKALVIWAPGGEASRLARFFLERPVDD